MEQSLHRAGRRLEPSPTKTAAGVHTVAPRASTAATMHAHLRAHIAPSPQAILFRHCGLGHARDEALTRLLTSASIAAGIEMPDGHPGGC